MGFRGEALASIAAISKITVITKTLDEEMGTKLLLEAGDVIKNEPIGAPVGTSMTIEDLFFNTPVRYKFLKKEYTETGYIEESVKRLAIINKGIAFKLINNGKTILQTTGSTETKLVVYSIFGEEIANSIVEAEFNTEDIKIFAIVGKPEIARSNRKNQLFFVNGRYIKDNTLTAATTKAFKGLIPLGRFGFCILDIRIKPNLIDVNVHPTKEEIRFKDEQSIFKAVGVVIHNALAKSELVENIFVPKYDDKNSSHFSNYTIPLETLKESLGEKNVDEVLLQPEENMVQSKKKSGFFNFKDKKSDKDIEEEELEKAHSEIYETLNKNPKFSYQEMLKEKEKEEKNKSNNDTSVNVPTLDWIGEDQTTEKLSKIQEKIKKSASMSIHTILNRYKEQLDEEEAETEAKIKAGIRDDDESDDKKESLEQEKTEKITETEEINQKVEEPTKEDVENRYKALFETYKAGDYLKEDINEEEKIEENINKENFENQENQEKEVIEKKLQIETLEEKFEKSDDEAEENLVNNKKDRGLLDKIQETLSKEAITTTPTLKPLAQEDYKEDNNHFSKQIKESVQKQVIETDNLISDFKSVEDESFVKKEEIKDDSIPAILRNKFGAKGSNTTTEANEIVESLIAQKIEKGETTGILDLDSINKILAQELKEKEELEKIKKEGSKNKFDFSKMYRSAFGVDTYQEQQQKKAFDESINMSQSFKSPEVTLFNDSIPNYSVIGVAFSTYIIIEMKDSIYIIDQHATHERLLYEEVKLNYYNEQYKDSQTLLLPDVITLSYREMEIVRKNIDVFHKAGFELEEFGINTIKLVAVPSMTEILNTKELFLDILDELDSVHVTGKDEIEERFLSTIACKAAVKANMVLDEKEIRALLDDLFKLPNPFTCPHGRPTAIKMTKADLERKFSRR